MCNRLLGFHDSVKHFTVSVMISLTVRYWWKLVSTMWLTYLEKSPLLWDVSLEKELVNEGRNLMNQVVTSENAVNRLNRKVNSIWLIAVFAEQNVRCR